MKKDKFWGSVAFFCVYGGILYFVYFFVFLASSEYRDPWVSWIYWIVVLGVYFLVVYPRLPLDEPELTGPQDVQFLDNAHAKCDFVPTLKMVAGKNYLFIGNFIAYADKTKSFSFYLPMDVMRVAPFYVEDLGWLLAEVDNKGKFTDRAWLYGLETDNFIDLSLY